MKGAALFLFTLMIADSGNRTAIQAYVEQTTSRLAAESPFPEVVLVSTGLIALMLMFILRDRGPARQTPFIVHREIRGLAGDEAATPVLGRRRFRNTGRLSRIVRALLTSLKIQHSTGKPDVNRS